MSYLLSLAPHGVRRRAVACSALVFAALACNPDDSTAPATDPVAATPTSTPAVTPVGPAVEASVTSLTAPGIPFGDFHLPTSMYKAPYTGSLIALSVSSTVSNLNSLKYAGMRTVVSLAGNRSNYTNSDGTFNMTKWKSQVYRFHSINFSTYVSAGTVIGHYLVDEPTCSSCWGGRRISASQVEEMSRYSKSLWPSMATAVRTTPTQLSSYGTSFSSLDFAWAQWAGPLHVPSFKMTPQQFRDAQVAAAKKLGLGLVFGLNYQDGGDGSSHINGTFAKDPNLSDNVYCTSSGCYRYAMSASEVKNVGTVFAQASYGCALISWKYDETVLSRSGMKDAISAVAYAAKSRSRTSCKT
jgi:hypothetical protein